VTSSLGRSNSFVIPASWGIAHKIATPTALGTHAEALKKTYLELYEGRIVAL
jgi:hypothetical protein